MPHLLRSLSLFNRPIRKNRQFMHQSHFNLETESIVFISYRRVIRDKIMARKCAKILERTPGLKYWLDEDDKCMTYAQSHISDIATANCIEQGLDAASALLEAFLKPPSGRFAGG